MKILDIYQNFLLRVPGNTLRCADLRFADLRFANLRYTNLRYANLRYANLHESDLRYADLRYADLRGADLRGAIFSKTKLKGALLPYFDETPIIPNIHKTLYEAASQPNMLNMRVWHSCDTTHCRAGWVVTLAGEAGRALESKIGTDTAAALIYMKSDPNLEQIPDWFASNEEALEDMRRLAA